MRISFTPKRSDAVLTVSKSGEKLTINGDEFDFTDMPDGATIPAREVPCAWIGDYPIERIDGSLCLTLILPIGPNPSQAVAFPVDLIDPPDGLLDIPFDPPPPEPEFIEEELDHVEV